jgi:hypothetical protein
MPADARRAARRAAIAALAIGALLLAGALGATLSHAKVRRAGTNDLTVSVIVDTLRAGHRLCQDGERVPPDAAALELTGAAPSGSRPTLAVELVDASTLAPVAGGAVGVGPSGAVTVPLRPAVARERVVRVCMRLRGAGRRAQVQLDGAPIAPEMQGATDDGKDRGGRIRIDYLRSGRESWWAFAPTVAERLGRGRAWLGSSVAVLAALLMLASISVSAWLLVRTS